MTTTTAVLIACLSVLEPTTQTQANSLPSISATVEALPLDLATWKSRPQVEVRVPEDGKVAVYSGVPLRVVLESKLGGPNEMAALRNVSDAVLLVRATDNYRTAVSAVAVAMDKKGERYLLALTKDGQPLGENQGPIRLITTADPERVRWVRMVNGIDLIRLSKPAEQGKAGPPPSR
jgi:hypothetical protein